MYRSHMDVPITSHRTVTYIAHLVAILVFTLISTTTEAFQLATSNCTQCLPKLYADACGVPKKTTHFLPVTAIFVVSCLFYTEDTLVIQTSNFIQYAYECHAYVYAALSLCSKISQLEAIFVLSNLHQSVLKYLC